MLIIIIGVIAGSSCCGFIRPIVADVLVGTRKNRDVVDRHADSVTPAVWLAINSNPDLKRSLNGSDEPLNLQLSGNPTLSKCYKPRELLIDDLVALKRETTLKITTDIRQQAIVGHAVAHLDLFNKRQLLQRALTITVIITLKLLPKQLKNYFASWHHASRLALLILISPIV